MTVAVKSKHAQRGVSLEFTTVVDWLAANGIDEYLPENPTFLVQDEPHVKRIIYRGIKFDGDERGYDVKKLGDGYVRFLEEDRVVPLVAPVTDEVRAAFEALEGCDDWSRAFLVEVGDHRKMEAYRLRLGLDERVSRIRLFAVDGDSRTCLSFTARDGAIHIKVAGGDIKDEDALTGAFALSERRIDELIGGLSKLQKWLKSERPALAAPIG